MQTVSRFEAVGISVSGPVKSKGLCLPAAITDGLARFHAEEQNIYKQKLKRLKKLAKYLVLENVALCDAVASVQEDLSLAIEERLNLLKKVVQIQMNRGQGFHQNTKASRMSADFADRQLIRKYWQEEIPLNFFNNKKNLFHKKKVTEKSHKRKFAKRKCLPIPIDCCGRPMFPMNLDKLTIHSLGEIITDKNTFHSENVIYPVGFCSSRNYASLKDPHKQTVYTCTVKDGKAGPRFDIVCDEDETTFIGKTVGECHRQVLEQINLLLGFDLLPIDLDTRAIEERGLKFFGLSHPSVQNMIQICPGARKCTNYKWIQFEVGLQFLDHSEIAPAVSFFLQTRIGFLPYILENSNKLSGDCCVDERTALARCVDAVIHFGRTCLTPTKILPTLYVHAPLPLDVSKVLERLTGTGAPDVDENLILVFDIRYVHTIGHLFGLLKNVFPKLLLSSFVTPFGAQIVSCKSPLISLDSTNKVSKISVCNRLKIVRFNVREVTIPEECSINDYNFIYVGPTTGSLTVLQLQFSENIFYQVDGSGETLSVTDSTRLILNRSKKLEMIKEAKIIGIVFTLVRGHERIVERLKHLIKLHGKRCYSFFIGKINEPKLGNIIGVDIFVYIACPENSIFDRNETEYLYKKVVVPWEVEVALNPSFKWSLNFETNFMQFVYDKECEVTTQEELRNEDDSSVLDVAVKAESALHSLHQNGAGEALHAFSWHGLSLTSLPFLPANAVIEGKRGVASDYSCEPGSHA